MPIAADTPLSIGVLARQADVGVETIRYYQRQGLVRAPKKPHGQIRRYDQQDVHRIRFIKSAQRLGFSLKEISELLRLADGAHCAEASRMAERKLHDVRQKLADLTHMEAVLNHLVSACHDPDKRVSCPLIMALESGDA